MLVFVVCDATLNHADAWGGEDMVMSVVHATTGGYAGF